MLGWNERKWRVLRPPTEVILIGSELNLIFQTGGMEYGPWEHYGVMDGIINQVSEGFDKMNNG